jgi:hypothetical protein
MGTTPWQRQMSFTFCGKLSLAMLNSVQALSHLAFLPCMEPRLVFWYHKQQERHTGE